MESLVTFIHKNRLAEIEQVEMNPLSLKKLKKFYLFQIKKVCLLFQKSEIIF